MIPGGNLGSAVDFSRFPTFDAAYFCVILHTVDWSATMEEFAFEPGNAPRVLEAIRDSFLEPQYSVGAILIVAGVFVVALSLIVLFQRRIHGRRRSLAALETFHHLIAQYDLSREEWSLAEHLADCCVPRERRHMLLLSHHMFDHAVELFRRRDRVPQDVVLSLRQKLGFPEEAAVNPGSTTQLRDGTPMVLRDDAGNSIRCRIVSRDDEGLVLQPESSDQRLQIQNLELGQRLRGLFPYRAGLFTCTVYVQRVAASRLRTSHGSLIRRARRRRYYRRRLRLPVQLRPELHRLRRQRGTERQATIVEISGSGASITNPFSSASTGIVLELRFQVGNATMRLRGRIVRVSRNGRILHVAFENIGAAQRERIVSYLVRRARAA
jgi:hypothetical protein